MCTKRSCMTFSIFLTISEALQVEISNFFICPTCCIVHLKRFPKRKERTVVPNFRNVCMPLRMVLQKKPFKHITKFHWFVTFQCTHFTKGPSKAPICQLFFIYKKVPFQLLLPPPVHEASNALGDITSECAVVVRHKLHKVCTQKTVRMTCDQKTFKLWVE